MKLRIIKDQTKGLQLQAIVELTDDETELINRYKAHKETLLKREVPLFGKRLSFDLKIGHLIKGQAFKCYDIAEILVTEEIVKEACKQFSTYLTVMRNFGGEEAIDYGHGNENKGMASI